MKTALIVLVALFAMAAASGRRGPNGVVVVDHAEPQINIDPNFDSAFQQPSRPRPNQGGPIKYDPGYAPSGSYPGKQDSNPYLRGGK